MKLRYGLSLALLLLAARASFGQTTRIKDIARLQGVRNNQIYGYGLVVGLAGSGDSSQTIFTTQSIASMLSRFGVEAAATQMKVKNVAAVMVTAELPPFVTPGDHIDVQVSSLGDAQNLQGGMLLQTPLSGADHQVYATAQGAISLGGYAASGGGGDSSVLQNHPTVGRIPDGAVVEKDVHMTTSESDKLILALQRPDYNMAAKIAAAVQKATGASAYADDAGKITVTLPEAYRKNPVPFVAMVNDISVTVEPISKVVINERTGTVVIGGAVRISKVAVAHAGLTVTVSTEPVISQPNPMTQGGSAVSTTKTDMTVKDKPASTFTLGDEDNTVEDLIKALNAIKATPRDIIAILQAIKEAGGLHGELETL